MTKVGLVLRNGMDKEWKCWLFTHFIYTLINLFMLLLISLIQPNTILIFRVLWIILHAHFLWGLFCEVGYLKKIEIDSRKSDNFEIMPTQIFVGTVDNGLMALDLNKLVFICDISSLSGFLMVHACKSFVAHVMTSRILLLSFSL